VRVQLTNNPMQRLYYAHFGALAAGTVIL
jgi:hypothetical protein